MLSVAVAVPVDADPGALMAGNGSDASDRAGSAGVSGEVDPLPDTKRYRFGVRHCEGFGEVERERGSGGESEE